MADWSVKIVEIDEVAAFVPDFPNAKQGDPLQAQQDDLVSWNNTTDNVHQPWETDSQYNPKTSSDLSDVIEPGGTSQTYEVSQTGTIYYYCSQHPSDVSERGTIVVPPPS